MYVAHKTKKQSKGKLVIVDYIPHGETRALALTFQGEKITEKGLGEKLRETDQGQAQKVKS